MLFGPESLIVQIVDKSCGTVHLVGFRSRRYLVFFLARRTKKHIEDWWRSIQAGEVKVGSDP